MSGTFNGYHVWLGIPPHEQPPNHYRLLGIAVFESDLDVIDHAADRQMAHVRTFQAGRNGALSQQLLNELASARLCLLNPARKTAYDESLRAKIGSAPRAVPMAAAPLVAVPLAAVPVAAVPMAAALPKAEPAAKAVPVTKPKAVAHATPGGEESSAPTGRLRSGASRIDLDIDDESMDALTSSPDFRIAVPRRSYNRDYSWKRPVAMGLMAAMIVISVMFLYYLARNLMQSPEWQRFIKGEMDPSAAQPIDLPPSSDDADAPPAPAPSQ